MQIYNKENLIASINKGNKPNYLFFWSQLDDYGFLSQWCPSKFTVNRIVYPTAEHYMMYQKAILFKDEETAQKILKAKTPNQVQNLGRQVKNFDRDVWKDCRFPTVVKGNMEKFGQNSILRYCLLQTKEKVLVEASPVDRIWGIGMDEKNELSSNPNKWTGLNLLGFALMTVRRQINEHN